MRLLAAVLLCSSVSVAATFSGQVIDAWSRLPVPFADVHVTTDGRHLVADTLGRFSDTAIGDSITITVSRIGYLPAELSIPVGPRTTILELRPVTLRLAGVTVSAARTPLPARTSGTVSVYDRTRLRSGGMTDAAELARAGTGAAARDYGNYSSLVLRGANAEHTLVAVDGVRQNSTQNGLFDLSTMALALAERVEVVRGPASAIFGSNALGGVVNVVTPEPERLQAELSAVTGSFGRRQLEFRHGNWLSPFGYFVAGELLSARNDFEFRDDSGRAVRLKNADIRRQAVFAKGRFQSGPHYASLLGEFAFTQRGVPGSTFLPSDSARRDDSRGQIIASYAIQPRGNLRTSLKTHASRSRQNYRDPALAVNDTHTLGLSGVQLEQSWVINPKIGLVGGGELASEALTSTAIGTPHKTAVAGWVQWRVDIHGFDILHVLRYDHASGFSRLPDSTNGTSVSSAFSPRVSLTWSGLAPLEFTTTYSRAFRAPSFNDLYWPPDAFTYGNPDLRPETGQTAEFDAGIGLRWLKARAGVCWNRLDDLIQWQPDSVFRFHPVNVQQADITVAELEAEVTLGPAGLAISGTMTRARADSFALVYRPALCGTAGAHCDLPLPTTPRVEIKADYTGPRFSDPANTDTMPGYLLLSVQLQSQPRLGAVAIGVEAGVRNLLDARYETARGYPTAGRNWYCQLNLEI